MRREKSMIGQRVRVKLDLHQWRQQKPEIWALSQGNKRVMLCRALCLRDCTTIVSETLFKKALRLKKRIPYAWIEGVVCEAQSGAAMRVRLDPYHPESYRFRADGMPDVKGMDYAEFHPDSHCYARGVR
jgi:hypothetical protein